MKLVPHVTDKANVMDELRLDGAVSPEGSPIAIPLHELELFADALMRENLIQARLSRPELNALSVADKVLQAQNKITSILAPLDLPVNPVLDIVLDLFSSEEHGRKVTVTDVAIAGHCAPTTGIRWITLLNEADVVQKTSDAFDQRRKFISLTAHGRALALKCIQVYSDHLTNGTGA